MSEPNYTISGYETCTISTDGQSITCHRCTMTSYHPLDVRHRYCSNCRMFHEAGIGEDAPSADSLLSENARLRAEMLHRAQIDAEDTHRLQSVCTALYAEIARLQAENIALRNIKDRVQQFRDDYPSDVFPGDVGKGARMAIERVLLLFTLGEPR